MIIYKVGGRYLLKKDIQFCRRFLLVFIVFSWSAKANLKVLLPIQVQQRKAALFSIFSKLGTKGTLTISTIPSPNSGSLKYLANV